VRAPCGDLGFELRKRNSTCNAVPMERNSYAGPLHLPFSDPLALRPAHAVDNMGARTVAAPRHGQGADRLHVGYEAARCG